MKNCALCSTEFIEEDAGHCPPQLFHLCNKYLHSSLAQETLPNDQNHHSFLFCPKCFQSSAELVDLNKQIEFYQKQISELAFIISLDILHRRGKCTGRYRNSHGKKLIELDVSSLPNYESWHASTSYYQQNASSAKELHNIVSKNNYPDELCDPLLPTPACSTDSENIVDVKIEDTSNIFIDETQNVEPEMIDEIERKVIVMENYNSTTKNQYYGQSSPENIESPQYLLMSSETSHHPKPTVGDVLGCSGSTKQSASLNDYQNSEFNPKKPYECHVCHKKLTKSSHLTVHMRTHTGERPFSCAICKKAFTTKPNLVAHERTHTGEKPYSCDVCEKRFNNESNLIHHKKIHIAEKPFRCDECEYSANTKHNLQVHKLKKHPVSVSLLG